MKKNKKTPKKITATYLHNAGLAYLQKFAASRSHFESILMRRVDRSCRYHIDQDREVCRDLVKQIAEKFENSGLLNDNVFTQGAVTRLRNQGKSKKYIEAKLASLGLERSLVAQLLSEEAEDTELQSAKKMAAKKRLFSKDPQKSLATLARAGFSYETALLALKQKNQDT